MRTQLMKDRALANARSILLIEHPRDFPSNSEAIKMTIRQLVWLVKLLPDEEDEPLATAPATNHAASHSTSELAPAEWPAKKED